MGQYFKAVNVTKKQFMDPDCFAKLMENSYILNDYIGGSLMVLLLDQISSDKFLESHPDLSSDAKRLVGRWSNNQIVFAGDYADPGQFCTEEYVLKKFKDEKSQEYFDMQKKYSYSDHQINTWLNSPTLYSLCEVFKEVKSFIPKSISTDELFLINHTQREFISLKNYLKQTEIDGFEWVIHPLPILLAQSNGQGGGDYYGKNEDLAGKWCGNIISTSYFQPSQYKEFLPFFKE